MATSMDDFLLQYYMQRRFNDMPAEVRAKYDDFLKANDGAGDFRGNMKTWRDKLMHEQPAGSGKYVNNDLPDPNSGQWQLADKDWEKLYQAFASAFRSMAASRDDFKDNKDATAFLDEHFGDVRTHLFSNVVASPAARIEIDKLLTVLESDSSIGLLLKDSLGDISFNDFKSALRKAEYNNEPKYQNALASVARELKYLQIYDPEKFTAFQSAGINLDEIEKAFEEAHPDPSKLANFKQMYAGLLNALEKKKINDVFKSYDRGKITGKIDQAKEKVAYDDKDSKDYLPPKRQDELTPLQRMRDYVGDTYNNVLGKYLSAHGNRVYFSPAARQIVAAIDGAKIKPTDGLAKVLDSAGDIKKNLQYKSPTATDHFEWFSKTMSELRTTMPKAFAGALQNGRQMRAIIEEMIMIAVRTGKVAEAKTAMEVLSVIKYGYTTSKIMDALGKEELKIFSDGGLSWNKNQGMQFVTTALDKSIKWAFMGVGYGITIAGNAYKLNGSKFNGRRRRIKGAQQAWDAQNTADKNAAINMRNQNNAADIATRSTYEAELARLDSGPNPINDTTIDAKRQDLDQRRTQEAQERDNLDQLRTGMYDNAKNTVATIDTLHDEIRQLGRDIRDIDTQIMDLNTQIADLDAKINDPATFAGVAAPVANAMAADLQRQRNDKQAAVAAKTSEKTAKETEKRNKITEYKNQTGRRTWVATPRSHGRIYSDAENNISYYEARQQRFQDTVNDNNALSDDIAKFTDARKTVDVLNTRIDKRNQQIDEWDDKHKDQYKELMAYWDMLETGRDSHTGSMYKWDLMRSNKSSQKRFDAKKKRIIDNYLSDYSYAA